MTTAFSELGDVRTVPDLLALRARATPDGEAYRQHDPATGRWQSLSWHQALARVQQWARAVAASGLPAGARVAILLPNGFDAMTIDQAVLACGCVPVPLHAIDNPGSIAYILQDAEVSLLVVAERAQWERIRELGQPLPHLQGVVVTGGAAGAPAGGDSPVPVAALADWLAHPAADTALPAPPAPHDLAALVYTSGTTGKPKGVMLTHHNVVSDVAAVLARITPTPQDVFLSFLPLSHTFERTAGYYLAIAAGSCVAYARSVAQLAEDMRTVRPTVLVSVPRIYERVHARVLEALSASALKMRLFEAAQAAGWRRFRAAQALPPPAAEDGARAGWARLLPWPLLRLLVARPLLAQFGGRVRVAVSGGAPLSPTIARCFLGLGLPLVQGYGMTETAPVVSANTVEDNDPATVGRALPGVEVRIGDNRELQVRGPIVMRGYWKRPEDTARVLSPDGWLSTGDQAEIVEGRIRILGRIKEIIVTSTGEKVPPGDLELAIAADPLFAQVFAVGENRPFIATVAVVGGEEWTQLAQGLGLDPKDPAALRDPRVQRAALARIERQTASFPRYAVPRAVHLVREPWTVENGLMTPTLKLKRNNLMARYATEIEALYERR
ncbi:long-chain acyl-CoA synthetase [Melaminivora alkalimesophila]|uniref:Long-chain acyl-CoA synthetase n=3 Tax=Melaminivora alkalimesophila TaxID=1165852 RepID=A0A317RDB2_9BURK|nr:long-chain fatty acid--CoA ligase [Melaminivora alkalimesophila]PWW46324.1 long-chain acyl-CoA synthetase [Melaminivora alkalimesophila]